MFRRKYFKGQCPSCKAQRKLTLINTDEELGVVWMRCDKCKQTHSYPVERVRKSGRVLTNEQFQKIKESLSKVLKYNPEKTYFIGQRIHHPKYDETGEVIKKESTAGKHKMIVVNFENSGKKKLVEDFKA